MDLDRAATARDQVTAADHELARQLAEEAGRLLVDLRRDQAGQIEAGELRDRGDRQAHDLLMRRLADLRPDDAVLSEEGKDNRDRLDHHRVWIVDPLDGTREFGEPPREDWAVHVALCVDGEPLVGAVALPARGIVYSTAPPPVAVPPSGEPVRIAASRTRAPAVVTEVATALGGELVYMGSAGAKAMAILSGEVDIYVHAGGQYEWDSAAPVAVALAAGLHCSRLDGTPLTYNHENPYLPDLLICRPAIAATVLDVLETASRRENGLTTDASGPGTDSNGVI